MLAENLSYALVQVLHNFGAAAVVGIPLFALAADSRGADGDRPLLWFTLLAWSTQALSGAGFGAVSYYFYGQLPDIAGVAIIALVIKIACAILGFALAATLLRARPAGWSGAVHRRAWEMLAGFGVLALAAAAFLRWFS